MKHRITYLVPNPDDFHPDLLTVEDTSFSVKNLKAAKEHRITLGLNELPQEVCLFINSHLGNSFF
jgi:hypothetical protein